MFLIAQNDAYKTSHYHDTLEPLNHPLIPKQCLQLGLLPPRLEASTMKGNSLTWNWRAAACEELPAIFPVRQIPSKHGELVAA